MFVRDCIYLIGNRECNLFNLLFSFVYLCIQSYDAAKKQMIILSVSSFQSEFCIVTDVPGELHLFFRLPARFTEIKNPNPQGKRKKLKNRSITPQSRRLVAFSRFSERRPLSNDKTVVRQRIAAD